MYSTSGACKFKKKKGGGIEPEPVCLLKLKARYNEVFKKFCGWKPSVVKAVYPAILMTYG